MTSLQTAYMPTCGPCLILTLIFLDLISTLKCISQHIYSVYPSLDSVTVVWNLLSVCHLHLMYNLRIKSYAQSGRKRKLSNGKWKRRKKQGSICASDTVNSGWGEKRGCLWLTTKPKCKTAGLSNSSFWILQGYLIAIYRMLRKT